jgi:prepilin-type N-terminal cleavage/methylation domain-containing protein
MGSKYKNPNGFTLAEAMIATVILGIAAAGILLPFTSGQVVRAEGVHRTLGAKLAADLMEKIVNTPFNQIVAGYNGYSELKGHVKDSAGVAFISTDLNYANFSRSVSCDSVYTVQQAGTLPSVFIRVTVRVSYGGSELVSLTRLVSQ